MQTHRARSFLPIEGVRPSTDDTGLVHFLFQMAEEASTRCREGPGPLTNWYDA